MKFPFICHRFKSMYLFAHRTMHNNSAKRHSIESKKNLQNITTRLTIFSFVRFQFCIAFFYYFLISIDVSASKTKTLRKWAHEARAAVITVKKKPPKIIAHYTHWSNQTQKNGDRRIATRQIFCNHPLIAGAIGNLAWCFVWVVRGH